MSADDILRAAGTIENDGTAAGVSFALLTVVVIPAVGQAERAFSSSCATFALTAVAIFCETPGLVAVVHGLDSFGMIPLEGKVQ
jgi:hypothetical protein